MSALATPPWFIDERESMAHFGGRDTLLICSQPDPPYGEPEIVAVVYRGYEDGPSWTNARLLAAAPDLVKALEVLLDRYVELVMSGDCGSWDVETEDAVILARAALTRTVED